MTDNDKKDFAEAVREVLKMYGQECGKFTLRMWWAALADYDLNTVLNALGAYCASPEKCRFAPKVGDIVGMIGGTKDERKDAATIAWARVLAHVNRYASTVFDDPAIHYAIAVGFGGSWGDVCDFDASDFACQDKKRSFITAYANYKTGLNYPPRLIGLAEMDGTDYQQCLQVVGNPEQAKLVHEQGSSQGLQALPSVPLVALKAVVA